MKVLIVSLTKHKIHQKEFVYPLKNQLIEYNPFVIDFKVLISLNEKIKTKFVKRFNLIVLSGTALKDFYYLFFWKKFKFLSRLGNYKIGICAGAQILALVNNYKLRKLKNKKIGVFYEKEKRFYLTSYLIKTKKYVARKVKKGNNLFITYHPEVFGKLKEEVNYLIRQCK